jgi:hypothetical protein
VGLSAVEWKIAPGRLWVTGALLVLGCVGGQARTEVQKIEDGDIDLVFSPEISRSRGEPGGIVLLWPRVIPRSENERLRGVASALQVRLATMLGELFPGRSIDIRPEPERVCMKTGCKASSVGVLIAVRDEHCVAVAIASAPGLSEQQLMPWVGRVTTALRVPFREPPESSLKIHEFVACEDLVEIALEREDLVREALMKAVAGR